MDMGVLDDDGANAGSMVKEPDQTGQHTDSAAGLQDPDLPTEEVGHHPQLDKVVPLPESQIANLASSNDTNSVYWNKAAVMKDGFEIKAPQVREPWQYVVYDDPEISEILQEYDNEGAVSYLVRLIDGRVEEVSFEPLLILDFLQLSLNQEHFPMP